MRLVLDARTAAFAALIDYGGTFPPASLGMSAAVDVYRGLRTAPERWTMGRFLCRASDLHDLAGVATSGMTRGEAPWSIGVIVDMSPGAAASIAQEFQREMAPAMEVGAAEVRIEAAAGPDEIVDAISSIDQDVACFIEVDRGADLAPQIAAIGVALRDGGMTGGAKLRCGGPTADSIPSVEEVTEFVWEASLAGVPFKATAGLHEPIRRFDAALGVERHGFVNLLLAAVAADQGEPRAVVADIVAETDRSAFGFGATTASWRHVAIPGSGIRRARRKGLLSFGSCDADEPIAELRTLGFLGEGA